MAFRILLAVFVLAGTIWFNAGIWMTLAYMNRGDEIDRLRDALNTVGPECQKAAELTTSGW